MVWFLEHLFPGFVQGLYANGVARESLARALNGTVTAGTILALLLFLQRQNTKMAWKFVRQ